MTDLPRPAARYAAAVLACLATAALAWPLTAWIDPANLVMLFLLAVFLVALNLGRGPALLAAVLNVLVFDFFFVPPQLDLAVHDAQYLITFAVMLVVALLTGQLTARLGQQAQEAQEDERRTRALYEVARELAGAISIEQAAETTRRFLRQSVRLEASVLVPDGRGRLRAVGEDLPLPDDISLPMRAYERGEAVEKRGASGRGGATLYLPMTAPMRVRGVLELAAAAETLRRERALLDTVASLAGIAAERLHYFDVAQETEVAMASERLRNTVLASLSHDLRTPLTALVGLADTLTAAEPPLPPPHAETARALRDQAAALAGMVANLLDLARLAAGGGLSPRREWQPLEEVVGSALKALGNVLGAHPVELDLPADLPLLQFDAVLIERVLANLFDNAARHAPDGGTIRVAARLRDDRVEVSISNAGPPFPSGLDLTMPFARAGVKPGTGLGLAIAKAIVEAHGGRLHLDNPPEGGARVRFELPAGQPPALTDEYA
jgi:two-component system sensor histidine kinase KdpD